MGLFGRKEIILCVGCKQMESHKDASWKFIGENLYFSI
jgi:hypothetical protein